MEQTINVNLVKDDAIQVYYEENAHIDNNASLLFIKSGEAEIQKYVDTVSKPEISDYVETQAKPLVSQIVNEIAKPTVDEYIENTIIPEINEITDTIISPLVNSAQTAASTAIAQATTATTMANEASASATSAENSASSATLSAQTAVEQASVATVKAQAAETSAISAANSLDTLITTANAFNQNVADKTDVFNQNVADKTDVFNQNVADKTDVFNQNVADKTDAFDQNVADATNVFNQNAADKTDAFNQTVQSSGAITFHNVANCIKSIPQDIKLELTDGTLTLKAGSKVYDGAGNAISLNKDYIVLCSGNNIKFIFYSTKQDKAYCNQNVSDCSSGAISPVGTGMFYNTSTKSVDFYNSGVLQESNWSFPLAIVNVSNGVPISIEQTFNGFGYIGNTIFSLPGVEGLIPDGRDSDGTSNNYAYKTSNVITITNGTTETGRYTVIGNAQDISLLSDGYTYNYELNINENNGVKSDSCIIGTVDVSAGKITSFNLRKTFKAVDEFDYINANNFTPTGKQTIIAWGMPDYSAGVSISGTSFTAPVPCLFSLIGICDYQNGNGGVITMNGSTVSSFVTNTVNQITQTQNLFLNKGDIITIDSPKTTSKMVYYPLKGA